MMSKTVMIASGKGGTGKSMVAINLAASIAYAGKRVVVLDMCHGLRVLDLYLGLELRALWDMCDVINNTCTLEDALIPVGSVNGMYMMAATQKCEYDELNADSLYALVSELGNRFDYVILDCPPGIGRLIDASIECSDIAVTVVTPDYAALRDADALEEKLLRGGIMERRYIVNCMSTDLKAKGAGVPIKDIDRGFRCRPLGMIPLDSNIRASIAEGVPIVVKRDSYIAANFDKIAARLMEI